MHKLFLLTSLSFGLSIPAFAQEAGTYRPGNAYHSVIAKSPTQCAAQCKGDAQCKGWNFVRPRQLSRTGVCEFNALKVSAVPSSISVSGENETVRGSAQIISSAGGNTLRIQSEPPAQTMTSSPAQNYAARQQRPANHAANRAAYGRMAPETVKPGAVQYPRPQHSSQYSSQHSMAPNTAAPMARPNHFTQGAPQLAGADPRQAFRRHQNGAMQNGAVRNAAPYNGMAPRQPQAHFQPGPQPQYQGRPQYQAPAQPQYQPQPQIPARYAAPQNSRTSNINPNYNQRLHAYQRAGAGAPPATPNVPPSPYMGEPMQPNIAPRFTYNLDSHARAQAPQPSYSGYAGPQNNYAYSAAPQVQAPQIQAPQMSSQHMMQLYPGVPPQPAYSQSALPPPSLSQPTLSQPSLPGPMPPVPQMPSAPQIQPQPQMAMEPQMLAQPQAAPYAAVPHAAAQPAPSPVPAMRRRPMTASQAEQSLFGSLYDDVSIPANLLPDHIPSDPDAPIPTVRRVPTGEIATAQLPPLR